MTVLMRVAYPTGPRRNPERHFGCSLGCAVSSPARLALLPPALVVALAVLPASAGAVQFRTEPVGLANNVPTTHENHINQDGLASACDDPSFMIPTETTTTAQVKYKKFGFKSYIQEAACVTVGVSTMCTAGDAIMSETYSPASIPLSFVSTGSGISAPRRALRTRSRSRGAPTSRRSSSRSRQAVGVPA